MWTAIIWCAWFSYFISVKPQKFDRELSGIESVAVMVKLGCAIALGVLLTILVNGAAP